MLSPLQPSENKLQASPSQVCSSLIHLCSCCRFPMAGPGGGALGSTRRGARYRSLTQQVSQAVGVASRTEGKAQAAKADAQGHGTGMEEVSTKHWATTLQTHFMLDIVPASLDQARLQASLRARHDLHACRSMLGPRHLIRPSTSTAAAAQVVSLVRGLGASSDQQELSGPADALHVRAQHSLDQSTGSLAVRLVLTNTLDAEINGGSGQVCAEMTSVGTSPSTCWLCVPAVQHLQRGLQPADKSKWLGSAVRH